MVGFIEDIDNGSITDVLQQWGCEPDDEELISIAVSATGDYDLIGPNFIPQSPRAVPSLNLTTNDPHLKELMYRYPKFIPASLPIRKRIPRPVCLFINYMGTRTVQSNSEIPLPTRRCAASPGNEASKTVTAYPSDAPAFRLHASVRPKKRQKVSRNKDSSRGTGSPGTVSLKPSLCPQK